MAAATALVIFKNNSAALFVICHCSFYFGPFDVNNNSVIYYTTYTLQVTGKLEPIQADFGVQGRLHPWTGHQSIATIGNHGH